MQNIKKGLSTVVLCTVLSVTGCRGEKAVYTSGMEGLQQTTEHSQDSEMTEVQEQIRRYVDVCGAVCSPGVYPITEDMRVFEAVELAGGFTAEADTDWLNQAEPVQDGQKLYIYTKEETRLLETQVQSGYAESEVTSDGRININQASKEVLMTLPGIGEAKAEALIQYREEYGAFASIEEIQNVPGIKSAVFLKIQDLITVDP